MNLRDSFRILLLAVAIVATLADTDKECIGSGSVTSKLFCYYSDARRVDLCKCSHIILPGATPLDQLQGLIADKGAKVLLTVQEFNQSLLKTLNATKIFGLEVQLKKLAAKQDITDFISTVRTKLGADLFVALSVPAKPEILAKYYDFKTLSKHVDVFTLQTHFIGASGNVTFHPSRLSGLWDVQNTDSVVDLVAGLGAPLNKLIIATPVQGFKFLLQNEEHTAPGSPALELSTLTRDELCVTMESEKWTLERDQDQAGPYIFRKNKWISFDDATSMDIKAKYARVRGLAGLALKDVSQDGGDKCGKTLLESAFNGLTKQARAPRGAVLQSLEREMLESAVRPFDSVQVSPYRISRVIDSEGHVHSTRQDTRTEFICSRQGYFVHPRSCNRFYRCVKFDQHSDEFSVFEFDCPAGLAFDERVEVCVWPGSLPDGAACAGSSEVAPVPRERFTCPEAPGYYADPGNCRWFFACMDHGKSPLTAYEFRCPYGLVFDQDNLLCEWSWLVPKCGSGAVTHETAYGDFSPEGRGAFELDLYNGLGSLNHVQLGGLSGPLHVTEAITYSNAEHPASGSGGYQISGGGSHVDDPSIRSRPIYLNNGYNYPASNAHGDSAVYTGQNTASTVIESPDAESGAYIDYTGDALKYYNAFAANRFAENASGFEYDQGHRLSQPALQSINIVAGGASGVASYAKNVDNLQYGVKLGIESIRPATLVSSTTISPIPLVTSVPIPSTAHFDTYNNYGVVANLPNLQYKLENPTIINHQLHQLGDINTHKTLYSASNVSLDYAGYATNAATADHLNEYHYDRPRISFTDGQNIGFASYESQYRKPQVMINEHIKVNQYNKPYVVYEQKPLRPEFMKTYTYERAFNGYNYDKPKIAFLEEPNTHNQPASIAFQQEKHETKVAHEGYAYNKPAVPFIEGTVKHSGYHYEKPAIRFEEAPTPARAVTPALIYQQIALQPATTYSEINTQPFVQPYQAQNLVQPATTYEGFAHRVKLGGHQYETPTIKLEEKPIIPVTTYKEFKPAETYPQVNVEVKQEGYHYEKPAVKFEEKPIVTVIQHNEMKPQSPVAYQQAGYYYDKPNIKFEEKLVTPVTTYNEVKPHPAVTYQKINHEVKHEGYHYEKPSTKFEEKPIVPIVTHHEVKPQLTVSYQQDNYEMQQGYHYKKPAISFEDKPAVIYPQVNHEMKHEGYGYERPIIKFEEKPSVPATTYQEINIQPAKPYQEVKVETLPVVHLHHEEKQQGYHYDKPIVTFEEKPATTYQQIQPVHTHQEIKHETPKQFISEKSVPILQEGYNYEKPAITFEEKPVVPAIIYQETDTRPPVTYHETKHEGYYYQNPKITLQEKPVSKPTYLPPVQTYQEVSPSITLTQHVVQPNLSSYSYKKPILDQNIQTQSYHEIHHKPVISYQEVKQDGYHYEKPKVTFEEKPPQAVNYEELKQEGYHYEKPKVVFEEKQFVPATTYQEINIPQASPTVTIYQQPKQESDIYDKQKIALVEKHIPANPQISYVHRAQPQPTPISSTYYEVKPLIFEQKPTYKQVIQAVTAKPVITNSFSINQYSQGYHYEKPTVAFEEKPASEVAPAVPIYLPPKQVKINPALNYIPPRPVKTYISTSTNPAPPEREYLPQLPVQTYLPASSPTIKETILEQPLTKTSFYQTGFINTKPTTPEPTYLNPVATIYRNVVPDQPVVYYDSRFDNPKVGERTIQLGPVVPVVPVTRTVQKVKTVTSKPIVRYEFSSLDYQPAQPLVKEKLIIHVPDREYLPVTTTTRRPAMVTQKKDCLPAAPPKRVYLPVTTTTEKHIGTITPSREYLPVTEILKVRTSPPTREYLPVTKRVRTKPTTTTTIKPSQEYLPVKSTKASTREYFTVKPTTPFKEYLPVSTTSKPNREYLPAIQVENYEFQPEAEQIIFSTRRPKVIKIVKSRPIVKVNDFHPILATKLGAQCTCASNTLTLRRRKPQKSGKPQSDEDATTRISDEEEYVTEEQLDSRDDHAPKKQSVIIVAEEEEDVSQNDEIRKQDIAKAVDSGLKLVKSAVKQGVKEGVQEALSTKDFDRYGPGGVRGRSETLQGTVDCQRAGLFRHPKRCNKFYACRWDEGKRKFTLHVFNCPIHLTFDKNLGACNWPSQGPACVDNTLLPST